MNRSLVALALTTTLLLTPLTPAWPPALAPTALAQDNLNCEDFKSQKAAQRELDRDPADPNNLDANNDGQACEEFFAGTAGTADTAADAGGGGGGGGRRANRAGNAGNADAAADAGNVAVPADTAAADTTTATDGGGGGGGGGGRRRNRDQNQAQDPVAEPAPPVEDVAPADAAAAPAAEVLAVAVRGENVRLRTEPVADAAVAATLQRGDTVTVTGDALLPDGSAAPVAADALAVPDLDVFVPVQTADGTAGWVVEVFLDPATLAAVPAPAPAAGGQDGGGRNRRNRNADNAGTDTPANGGPEPAPAANEQPAPSDVEATYGTIANPAPFGAVLVAPDVSVTPSGGGFTPEFGGLTAQDGFTFFVFDVLLEATGTNDHDYSPDNFLGQDAATGTPYASVIVDGAGALGDGTLAPGDSVSGTVVLEVEEAAAQLLVTYDPDLNADGDELVWRFP